MSLMLIIKSLTICILVLVGSSWSSSVHGGLSSANFSLWPVKGARVARGPKTADAALASAARGFQSAGCCSFQLFQPSNKAVACMEPREPERSESALGLPFNIQQQLTCCVTAAGAAWYGHLCYGCYTRTIISSWTLNSRLKISCHPPFLNHYIRKKNHTKD